MATSVYTILKIKSKLRIHVHVSKNMALLRGAIAFTKVACALASDDAKEHSRSPRNAMWDTVQDCTMLFAIRPAFMAGRPAAQIRM